MGSVSSALDSHRPCHPSQRLSQQGLRLQVHGWFKNLKAASLSDLHKRGTNGRAVKFLDGIMQDNLKVGCECGFESGRVCAGELLYRPACQAASH
jgi:hypothetical protein